MLRTSPLPVCSETSTRVCDWTGVTVSCQCTLLHKFPEWVGSAGWQQIPNKHLCRSACAAPLVKSQNDCSCTALCWFSAQLKLSGLAMMLTSSRLEENVVSSLTCKGQTHWDGKPPFFPLPHMKMSTLKSDQSELVSVALQGVQLPNINGGSGRL